MFDDDPDFMREVIAEGQAIHEAEREAALNEPWICFETDKLP